LLNFDSAVSQFCGFSLRTGFAPKHRLGLCAVVISGFDEPVSAGGFAAVAALDVFLDLPLGLQGRGSENEFINPEENQAAYEIGHDCCG
jgi:hypothetical protein